MRDTATICQKVVSRNRPGIIHGIVSRIARHMCTTEEPLMPIPGYSRRELETAAALARCSAIIQSPIGPPFVAYVASNWPHKISSREIVRYWRAIVTWEGLSGKDTGRIEREDYKTTFELFVELKGYSR